MILPGQYLDEETGLHYNYFRDYDPVTGRYVESDPIGIAGGLNPYLYANANPLRWTDPSGLIPPGWWEANRPPSGSSSCDLGPPSRSNNRNLQRNIKIGALAGGTIGTVLGAVIVANIIGFPEVEIVEGAGVLLILTGASEQATAVMFGGALLGGSYGAVLGGASGAALTTPTLP